MNMMSRGKKFIKLESRKKKKSDGHYLFHKSYGAGRDTSSYSTDYVIANTAFT